MRWLVRKIKDKLFDLCPCWLYRFYDYAKHRPYWIKRWLIRANGHIPDCDCWEFNETLARTIEEGLSYMLYHGVSESWINDGSVPKQRSDLTYVKNVMADFRRYKHMINLRTVDWEQHQKDLDKAFMILGRYMWGLWD